MGPDAYFFRYQFFCISYCLLLITLCFIRSRQTVAQGPEMSPGLYSFTMLPHHVACKLAIVCVDGVIRHCISCFVLTKRIAVTWIRVKCTKALQNPGYSLTQDVNFSTKADAFRGEAEIPPLDLKICDATSLGVAKFVTKNGLTQK